MCTRSVANFLWANFCSQISSFALYKCMYKTLTKYYLKNIYRTKLKIPPFYTLKMVSKHRLKTHFNYLFQDRLVNTLIIVVKYSVHKLYIHTYIKTQFNYRKIPLLVIDWIKEIKTFFSSCAPVLGLFLAGFFPAGLFPACFSPIGIFPAGLFPARYFPR